MHGFYIAPNLPRALLKGAVSSGTFVLTRFLTICFFYKPDQILTKPGQNLQLISGYKRYQQFDPKRYVGVTGVKNVKKKLLLKMLLLLQITYQGHMIHEYEYA